MVQTPVLSVTTNSEEETRRLAGAIARLLRPGDVVALVGILGAGKTCFVKGMAEGLGLTDASIVRSPTFILASEYPTSPPLYHLDAYRLKGGAELEQIGVDDYLASDGICAIEWADRVENCLPADYLVVIMTITSDAGRRVDVSWVGKVAPDRLRTFQQELNKFFRS